VSCSDRNSDSPVIRTAGTPVGGIATNGNDAGSFYAQFTL
jgi:hypothetical protein